jgi:hypothetical protein
MRMFANRVPTNDGVIVFTGDFNADWLYDVLQAVVLLVRERPINVQVVFMPNKSAPGQLLQLVKRFWHFIRGSVQRIPRRGGRHAALYSRLSRGERIEIDRAAARITMERAKVPPWAHATCVIAAFAGAWRLWLNSFHRGRFQALRFLHGEWKGARVGDLAASTYFRSEFGTALVRPHPYLFYTLYESCYVVNVAEHLLRRVDTSRALTMTPEPTYIPAASHRYFQARGLAVMDGNQPCVAIEITAAAAAQVGRRGGRRPVGSSVLSPAENFAVERYFAARLRNAAVMLPYMRTGVNDNGAGVLLDVDSQEVTFVDDCLRVAVFLHSFADAQYYFGLDGFESLADWTFQTIERCLENDAIERVLVKPHPSESYRGLHTDAVVLADIQQRYGREPRVMILHPKASLIRLCGVGKLIGVTHHGSVAEELVYLGRPVIASSHAPWEASYPFARLWSTPAEYARLLGTLSAGTYSAPTEIERFHLYRFVMDKRLCEVPTNERVSRIALANIIARTKGVSGPVLPGSPAYEEYSSGLDNLSQTDEEFYTLLEQFARLPASVQWQPGTNSGVTQCHGNLRGVVYER